MPAEKPKQNNPKQMITIVVTVLIFLVVAYEVYGMFGGDESAPAPAPAQQASNQGKAGGSAASASAAPATEMLAPKQAPVQVNTELLRLQQDTEAKYLAALNELQMLKIQKEIADTKEGITSATLATATAEKSITDLLTVQQGPMGGMSGGGNSGGMGPYSSTSLSPTSPTSPNAPALPPASTTTTNTTPAPAPVQHMMASPEAPYALMSVSFKDMRWNAVLSIDNKYYNVTIGDTLPADEATVTSIDRNSIVLQGKDKKLRRITMVPSLG